MTHFIFDCDDVLLDWETAFIDYVEQMTHTTIDRTGPNTWCLAEWIGYTTDDAKAWVESFNGSKAFGQLSARPGARELVWDLRNAGHTISVLTACGDNLEVRLARMKNLQDAFKRGFSEFFYLLPYEQVTTLPLGASKFNYLFEFTRNRDPRNVVFVEDNFEHAKSGVANGIRSYCLRRSHNRQQEVDNPNTQVIWIDDLDAIRLDFLQSIQPNIDIATEGRIMVENDHKCERCGSTLRVETVRVPVVRVCDDAPVGYTDYEDRDEVSDCPRCNGSY